MSKLRLILIAAIIMIASMSVMKAQNPGGLPDNVDTADCTSQPPAKAFDIALMWKTTKTPKKDDEYVHGRSTPIVGDFDGDGEVEIMIPATAKTAGNNNNAKRPNTFITNNLLVLEGKTGNLKYVIKTCDFQVHGQTIACADVDKDGKAEVFILATGPRTSTSSQTYGGKYLFCYDASKANSSATDFKWKGYSKPGTYKELEYAYIPMVADVNQNGTAEIVCGNCVFNAITGQLLMSASSMDYKGMGFGGPHNVHGNWQQNKVQELGEQYYMNALADIDGDGQLELCAGACIYELTLTNETGVSGNKMKKSMTCEQTLPYDDMYDGQTIVLDFDNDGDLDIVVLGRNKDITNFTGDVNHIGIYVWEGQTDKIIGYYACDPKTTSQSIPFAGDIDGDGFPEVIFNGWVFGANYNATANPDYMHVFRYTAGFKTSASDRAKANNIKEIFTRAQTQEYFESAGFTVFDFNQDGKAEIVFRGEKSLYILDGTTLTKLCQPMSVTSGTTAEYPVVADIDGDNHAEIIVTEEYTPSNGPAGCVSVFKSATPGAWGPARKVWNQWPYYVVNINEDLTVPQYLFNIATPFGASGVKPFNAFLQQATKLNANGEMFSPAADAHIISGEEALQIHCDSITIDIDFTNTGTESLYQPYGLTIYKDSYQNSDIIYQQTYTSDLAVKDTIHLHLKYTEADLAQWNPVSKFIVSINDIGSGFAEEGNQQKECDVTDDTLTLNFTGFVGTETGDTIVHLCVGDTYAIGNSIYNEDGQYVDTLINRNGCDSIVTSHVYVHPISVDLGPDQSFCQKDYVPVTLDAGSEPTFYEWSDGSTQRTLTVFNTGDYSVVVSNEYGCKDSDEVNVTIIDNPTLYITKDPEDFCQENMTVLTAHSNIPDVTYQWNTGDASESVTVYYHGTYTVIADNQGCKGSANIQIDICPCEVWVPNAFSPDGDGLNDVFQPQISSTLDSYQLNIFDRWGRIIFTTTDPLANWNGEIEGKKAPIGVYSYIINYTCAGNPKKKLLKHGSVTIIR